GEVVQRGIDVRAAHRLDEGRGDVVVLVARPVVAHGSPGHRLLDVGEGERGRLGGIVTEGDVLVGDAGRRLEGGQRPAGIAPGDGDEVVPGVVVERVAPRETAVVGQRGVDDLADLLPG